MAAAPSRVRVFNQSLLEGLVDPGDAEPPVQREAEEKPLLTVAQRDRKLKLKRLKDLEELRQRRYERNRRCAETKAIESDRQVNINEPTTP